MTCSLILAEIAAEELLVAHEPVEPLPGLAAAAELMGRARVAPVFHRPAELLEAFVEQLALPNAGPEIRVGRLEEQSERGQKQGQLAWHKAGIL